MPVRIDSAITSHCCVSESCVSVSHHRTLSLGSPSGWCGDTFGQHTCRIDYTHKTHRSFIATCEYFCWRPIAFSQILYYVDDIRVVTCSVVSPPLVTTNGTRVRTINLTLFADRRSTSSRIDTRGTLTSLLFTIKPSLTMFVSHCLPSCVSTPTCTGQLYSPVGSLSHFIILKLYYYNELSPGTVGSSQRKRTRRIEGRPDPNSRDSRFCQCHW